LRPGHRVRRPHEGDRQRQAAAGRDAHARGALRPPRPRARARDDLQAGRRGARLRARAERSRARRDPDVRRGRGPPQRGRRDRRAHVARRARRRRQDLLHDRPPDLRDGDQVRQMGIPFLVSRSGLTQMGYDIAQKVA
jgi:hypothetical protein